MESQPDIRSTKERAQLYAQSFNDTRAFLTDSGWYAIVIGPMERDFAESSLAALKLSGQIPSDSFVSDGVIHEGQIWPATSETNTVVIETPTETTETVEVTQPEEVVVVEPPEPQFIPDEDLKATKKLERTWSRDLKKEIQTYMVWTGDYDSAIDGAYGPGTRRAIRSFQEREGLEPTGYLTQTQVDMLTKGHADRLERLGVAMVRDLDAGIEIQMPTNLIEFGRFEPPFVHYKSTPGSKASGMLISQEGDRSTLKSLYDIMETFEVVPPEGYRVKKRDWFVLSGRNETTVSYTYARVSKGLVKGFTLVWPPEMDGDMKPVATAMYNSFNPIGEYALDETLGYGDSDNHPVNLTEGIETAEARHQGTGFVINSRGVVLTHISTVANCRRISLDGTTDLKIAATNSRMELAILKPISAYLPDSYALFSSEAPELGTDLSVAAFTYPEVMEQATLSYGKLSGTVGISGQPNQIRLDADLEDGDAGGPVMDDRGAVVGMQLLQLDDSNPIPAYVNVATKAKRIMALLDRYSIQYGRSTAFDSVDPVDLTHMASDFTVKISCWD